MKKSLVVAVVSAAAFVLPVTASVAAESSAFAQVTSNYVFRGQTQTQDDPAVQAGYDIKQSKDDTGWYAGVFASNVTDGLEIDLFGGWKDSFGAQKNMGYDVGVILYKYTDSINTDITEVYAGFNYETAFVKLYAG
ncbi:MAG: TorF family putative porin, partial [Gammaproteobacteria bacterium]|nr:TorF family putative porin [Gammaproteobacteria bacterium]